MTCNSLKRFREAVVVCVNLLCLLRAEAGPKPFWDIKGTIRVTNYVWEDAQASNSTISSYSWSFDFDCVVGSNQWRIDSTCLSNGKEEMFCDGTNLYQRLITTSNAADIFHGKKVPYGIPMFIPHSPKPHPVKIDIFPGTAPLEDIGIGIPWIAFCCGDYLKTERNVFPLPTVLADRPNAFGYRPVIAGIFGPLGTPRMLELFTSQSHLSKSIWDRRLHLSLAVESARKEGLHAFPDGILKFKYEVISLTNISGFTFPAQFKYADYAPTYKGGWTLDSAATGQVIAIAESPAPVNVFQPGTNQSIVDWRFQDSKAGVDAIQYRSTTLTNALPTNSLELQGVFLRATTGRLRSPPMIH